jgi:hypothetical protein
VAGRLSLLALAALVTGWLLVGEASAASPYGSSSILGSVSWDQSSKQRYGHGPMDGADIWDSMWASDGLIYGVWGDGEGFAGTSAKKQLGVSSITGSPPSTLTGSDVYLGSNPAATCLTTSTVGGKPHGVVALPSSVMYVFHLSEDKCTGTWLARSTNNGTSWTDNVSSAPWPDASGFSPAAVLQTGQAQAGALVPDSGTTPYLYIYGTKNTDAAGSGKNYLARVPASPSSSIEALGNWSYYSGTDGSGNPTWASSSASAVPVWTDPDHAESLIVSFDKAIGRYIAYNDHGTGCGGGPCMSQLGLFDAPSPWGPWTTFDYEENFDNTGCGMNCLGSGPSVGWALMQKWMSSDGLTIWPEYSSIDMGTTSLYDSLNLIKGTVSLASGSTIKGISTASRTPAVTDKLSLSNPGNLQYIDRTYRFTSLPAGYSGLESIRLANNDKANTSLSYLTFTITTGETVCLGFDSTHTPPSWLSSWTNTGKSLVGTPTFNVYKKTFPAGSVTIGGPASGGADSHNTYIAFVNCI